jgi:hypothetical protein
MEARPDDNDGGLPQCQIALPNSVGHMCALTSLAE